VSESSQIVEVTPAEVRHMVVGEQRSVEPAGLYLDLLKKALTNTIYTAEPGEESEAAFVRGFIDHYIQGPAVSMLPLARFDNLQFCIDDVLKKGVPGDLIETGVWRGGATIFMRAMLKARGVTDRLVWVADSFEGLPEPDADRFPIEAETHNGALMTKVYDRFAADLEAVKSNFRAYGLLDDQVRFLKGWFKDTLPSAPISSLAIVRLDGDYYESTMDALTNLYDKLSVGGYAIIDDYAEDAWTHCRQAVDEFRRQRGIDEPMIQVDSKCFYWRRDH
jgi:Macrocin-O-methyltransferase (TylF)